MRRVLLAALALAAIGSASAQSTKASPKPEAAASTISTPGIDFPYPAYLQNIAREIDNQFSRPRTPLTMTADVRFMVRRDGTVDPNSVLLTKSSGNYAFDQRAIGAIDAAGKAKQFGPLPAGFRGDILPMVFRFAPAPTGS